MSPVLAASLVGGLLVAAAVVGIVMRALDGRRRDGRRLRFERADAGATDLGARATLVQFSTETCARCPQVRRLLTEYVGRSDDLAHVEVDLSVRPDLSARYRVLQMPTTFVVDSDGAVRARFHGVPRRDALDEALAAV